MVYRRKFAGKIFTFDGNVDRKGDAKDVASKLRKKGWLARVTPAPHRAGWDIWKRRKK